MNEWYEWYVLERDGELEVVMVTVGNDPLHGRGSWNEHSGPFKSAEAAEEARLVAEKLRSEEEE